MIARLPLRLLMLCLLLAATSTSVRAAEPVPPATAAAPIDAKAREFFERKVRPLLAQHCYECHAADSKKVKGGLVLDTRAGWEEGGDSGPAVVPGDPDKSIFITAVRYTDEFLQMPPKKKLSPADIAVFEKWVEMGAPDPRTGAESNLPARDGIDLDEARKFWAFQAPKEHDAPKVNDETWALDDIDRFILAALETKGLQPAPDADRRAWLRRVTYDLTGLPPTLEEIDAFISDDSAEAYETVVDRLLASPRFGERFGQHWLDLARYADTNGGDFNATFYHAWRYRNYVIDAFNSDKPYDRFVREQIAGDLLPHETNEQRGEQLTGTAFLALGTKMLSERDKEKLQLDIADEQTDVIGRVFMGMTLGCARCHDHKFDPITQRDYFAVAGILHNTVTIEGESQQYVSAFVSPALPLDPEHAAAIKAYEAKKKPLDDAVKEAKKQVDSIKKAIAKGGAVKPKELPGIVVDDAKAKLVGDWKPSTFVNRFVGKGYIHDDKKDKGSKSVTWTPTLPKAGEYEVRISYASGNGRDTKTPVTIHHADGETKLHIDQNPTPPIDDMWRSLGRFRFEKGEAGWVRVSTEGTTEYVIADAAQFIPVELLEKGKLAKDDAKEEDSAEIEKLKEQLAAAEKELKAREAELKELEKTAPPPAPQTLGVRDRAKPTDLALRVRGETHNKGDVIERGFISVLSNPPPLREGLGEGDERRDASLTVKKTEQVSDQSDAQSPPPSLPLKGEGSEKTSVPPHRETSPRFTVQRDDESGRRELAEWIASPHNPLTARVMVNRLWHHLMGAGLVRTVDNFGHLGDRPSHPQLLDTLAVDFIESGWSVKTVVRRIALSRAYRMAVRHHEPSFLADPENRLLWRANRRTLSAEEIRDSLLAVSDQLDPEPAEAVVAGLPYLAVDNNSQGKGGVSIDDHTRRSVYLPLVRNFMPPILTTFDFADRDMVVGRRPVTNVPAQALFLMNSPFVQRSAATTADRLLGDQKLDDAQRIDRAFALILTRQATDREAKRMLGYIHDHVAALNVAEGVDTETRIREAWSRVVQALFASTEFRMVE